jgi:hypothetical protein
MLNLFQHGLIYTSEKIELQILPKGVVITALAFFYSVSF